MSRSSTNQNRAALSDQLCAAGQNLLEASIESSYFADMRVRAALLPTSYRHFNVLSGPQDVQASYDYVIIGGGTAGLTVADRLTEDGKYMVLVIEHGSLVYSDDLLTVYNALAPFADPSKYLYPINSIPQVGIKNRTGPVWIGNVVGGGSAINGMVATRGTRLDYDRWGSFWGNSSWWNWKNLLPYFEKAMIFTPPPEPVQSQFDITYNISTAWGGDNELSGVHASWPSYQYPGIKFQWDAFKELPGVDFPQDGSAGTNGVYWHPTFMDPRNITRSFARTAHFDGLNRSNYHLLPNSKVTKILLDGYLASGVAYRSGNGSSSAVYHVQARKETILSAGTIHSPQILQLSGIGPKKVLEAARIAVQVDLPGVGQNFQDHPQLNMTFQYRNYSLHPNADDMKSNRSFISFATELWNANKTGPYSIAAGNAGSFLGLPVVSPDRYEEIAKRLDTQNVSAYLSSDSHPDIIASYRAQMKSYAAGLRSKEFTVYHSIFHATVAQGGISYYHPLSRGTVNINSSDPEMSEPLVDYRVLTNPLDIVILIELMKFTRRYYLESKTLVRFEPVETNPGGNATSDAELEAFIRNNLSPTVYHPVGTCAMMPRNLGGVVDENLLVHGVERLRVVDASILPTTIGVNTCQTVYAIAERAVELIRTADRRSGT